jgi:hypothetical protein
MQISGNGTVKVKMFFVVLIAAITSGSLASSQELTQQEAGVMRFAGTCIAAAEVGNEILRAKGKTSNVNDVIAMAQASISSLLNRGGAMDFYKASYLTMHKNLDGQIGDAKAIFTMQLLTECSRIYLSALPN